MPYFTRQPYAPLEVPAVNPSGPDILALADAILAQQSAQTAEGPFRLRSPLAAGGTGTIVLTIAADPGVATPPLRLDLGDLTGPSGRIPAPEVRLDPAVVQVMPGGATDLRITVHAPPGTPPGLYAGTLSAAGEHGFTARIEVPVTA